MDGNTTWGVNGETGQITDMNELDVWDTYSVKAQTLKTAIEVTSKMAFLNLVTNNTSRHTHIT